MMRAKSFWLTGAALLALPMMAHAQSTSTDPAPKTAAATQADSDSVSIDEVVVTAQGRTQRLQDVPVAVSVMSGNALAKNNITTVEALSSRLPAVKIVSGPLTDLVNVRGVGSGQNPGFEQSVGTFVDGLYRGRSRATRAALFDVERVEVLKGPQTIFFGNNAIAGALNVATRKPGHDLEYNGSASYGFEYGDYTVEAGVSAPINDKLAIRVAGQASGMDGYIENPVAGDGPRQRNLLGRVSLRWEPTSNLTSDLRFDIGRQRAKNAFSATILNCPSAYAGARDFACGYAVADNGGAIDNAVSYKSYARPSYANYDFKEGGLTNVLDLGGATLKSITGYFEHDFNARVQLVPVSAGGVLGYDMAPSPIHERVRQTSQEIRLESATGGQFEYIVGAYYARLQTAVDAGFGAYFLPFGSYNPLGTTNANTPVTALNQQRYKDDNYSAFGALTWHPIEPLRVNVGLRYTSVEKEAHRRATFGTAPNADMSQLAPFDAATQAVFASILGADTADFPNPTRKDAKWLPSLGVQYHVTPDVMAYANYAKGFKAGGYSGQNTISVFNPETVDSYELGVKSVLLDRRLTLNMDVFRSDYSNLQETTITFNPLPVTTVANAAESRTQGIEGNADLRVTSNFRLTADVAYLDAKYRSYPNGVCTAAQASVTPTGCFQDMSGKARAYSPKWSGNLGAELTVAMPQDRSVRINPLLYFTSGFFTTATADPLLRQGGFSKVDLRLAYGPDDGGWEVSLLGKNLTDKATASYRNTLTGGNGSVYALPDPPRSISVQFTFKR